MLQNTQLTGFCGNRNFIGQFFHDNLESYAEGDSLMFLNSNNGFFSGTGWVIRGPYTGIQGHETIESYTVGATSTGYLNGGGVGWADTWNFKEPYLGLKGHDNIESYTSLTDATTSVSNEWTNSWEVR